MGRSYIGDTGCGSPFGDDGDDGCGDPGVGDGAGCGDPHAFGFISAGVGPSYNTLPAYDPNPTTYVAGLFSSEGGWLVEVMSTSPDFLPMDGYRVDFVKEDVIYPEDEPGSYSAVEGYGNEVRSFGGGTILRFALPKLGNGVYDLMITHPLGWILHIPSAVTIVNMGWSLEVDAVRQGLPSRVYRAKGELPELPAALVEIP